MNLYEARHLALTLMREHGLIDWTFSFDHARRRFGSCRYRSKRITLSRPLTLLNPIDQVRDTILHEIAHALCPEDGHGAKWKAMCRKLGAKPERCYTDEAVVSPPRAPARFLWGCATCDWWVERRRRTRPRYVCRHCRGKLSYRQRVEMDPARPETPPVGTRAAQQMLRQM